MNSSHISIGLGAPQLVPILIYLFPHMPPDAAASIATLVAAAAIGAYMLAQRFFPKLNPAAA